MYTIQAYIGGTLCTIYAPGSDTLQAYNITIEQTINEVSKLTFTVPPTNPFYEGFEVGAQSAVVVYKDNVECWRGYVHQVNTNFRKEKTVVCDDLLYLLTTTIQEPHHYSGVSYDSMIRQILANHNDIHGTFAFGHDAWSIGFGGSEQTQGKNVSSRYTNYEDTLSVIKEDVIGTLDEINQYPSMIYLDENDYSSEELTQNYVLKIDSYNDTSSISQTIQFGYNLLDYASGLDMAEVYTQICPIGARLDTQTIPGLDDYVTIKSVNSNKAILTSTDEELIEKYGARCKIVQWEDVTTPSALKTKAQQWLNGSQFANLSITLSALDMSLLNAYLPEFKIGAGVRVIAKPFGINTVLPIQQITKNLSDPTKSTITLSQVRPMSLTQMQARQNSLFKKELLK